MAERKSRRKLCQIDRNKRVNPSIKFLINYNNDIYGTVHKFQFRNMAMILLLERNCLHFFYCRWLCRSMELCFCSSPELRIIFQFVFLTFMFKMKNLIDMNISCMGNNLRWRHFYSEKMGFFGHPVCFRA
jgi:hypothetical protein